MGGESARRRGRPRTCGSPSWWRRSSGRRSRRGGPRRWRSRSTWSSAGASWCARSTPIFAEGGRFEVVDSSGGSRAEAAAARAVRLAYAVEGHRRRPRRRVVLLRGRRHGDAPSHSEAESGPAPRRRSDHPGAPRAMLRPGRRKGPLRRHSGRPGPVSPSGAYERAPVGQGSAGGGSVLRGSVERGPRPEPARSTRGDPA